MKSKCPYRLTAGSVSLQLHLWTFALHTGVQWHSTYALQQGSGQNAIPTVQCCSAKQAHSRQCVTAVTPMEFALHTGVQWHIKNVLQHCSGQNAILTVQCCSAKLAHSRQCVTAVTPMEICSSYRCPVAHQKCSATLFRAKRNPHCSVLLCKTGSQQAVCHCSYTYGICSSYRCPVAHQKCSATLFRVKCNPHCSVLLCKTGSQQAVCHCSYTYGICSSYRCPVAHQKCSATLFRAKRNPHCSVLLCKTGSQQAVCHCSYTYGDLLFIQVSSGTSKMFCNTVQGKTQSSLFSAALQNWLTAGSVSLQLHLWNLLFIQVSSGTSKMLCNTVQGKMQSPLFSAALQNRLTAGSVSLQLHLWNLLFIQVSSGTSKMFCNTVQGKTQSSLFSAALQNWLTAGSVSLQLHLWRFALHTGVQWHSTYALQQGSGQNAIPTVQCCSAKQAHSRQCVTAVTPMEICSSYRCPVAHHKCSATLFRAKRNPHCSVLLCKTGSQQAVCHCSYTYGDLLFIQVSSGTSKMLCNTVQGKMQSPLFSAALQNRLTAGSVSLQLHL